MDNAEHVLIECPAYEVERGVLAGAIEVASLIDRVTATPERWNALRAFAEHSMRDRARKELAKEAAGPRCQKCDS